MKTQTRAYTKQTINSMYKHVCIAIQRDMSYDHWYNFIQLKKKYLWLIIHLHLYFDIC